MPIHKSTIYFNNREQFCGKRHVQFVVPRSPGKIEKYFSSKLTDYFIQGVRNKKKTYAQTPVNSNNWSTI